MIYEIDHPWQIPGVPAAGHITAKGYWHPGRIEGCVKCEVPKKGGRRHDREPQADSRRDSRDS